MYCEKCHKQSPDNFESCAYCGASLEQPEAPKPSRYVKKTNLSPKLSLKKAVIALVAVGVLLCCSAIATGVLTGAKPESTIKTLAFAIESNNADLYYSLFDEQIKAYKKEHWYYNDEETFKAMVEPLNKSVAFYNDNCGENFKVEYKITHTEYLTDEQLEKFNEVLGDTYGYKKFPTQAAVLDLEINVEGDKGSYTSVYQDFYCIKIGRFWYKTDVNKDSYSV